MRSKKRVALLDISIALHMSQFPRCQPGFYIFGLHLGYKNPLFRVRGFFSSLLNAIELAIVIEGDFVDDHFGAAAHIYERWAEIGEGVEITRKGISLCAFVKSAGDLIAS